MQISAAPFEGSNRCKLMLNRRNLWSYGATCELISTRLLTQRTTCNLRYLTVLLMVTIHNWDWKCE